MRFASRLVLVAAAGALLAACAPDPRSGAGFRLPAGDAEHGRAVFAAAGCNTCHRVAGGGVPAPTASPAVPVVLGGEVPHARSDGELLAAILVPSHVVGGYPDRLVTAGGRSRMPELADRLTARDLVDVVAFLQSRYRVVRPGRAEPLRTAGR